MCQGLHLSTELLDCLVIFIVCCCIPCLVIVITISRLNLGTVHLCCLLSGGLAKSALVLILIAYYFHDLAKDFLICDLAV